MAAEPSARPPVRVTIWLRGRVQGVGMRWWIRSRALERGLVGWARNLDDGRVEVVAIGPEDDCRWFLAQFDADHHVPGRPGQVAGVVARWSDAPESPETLPSGFAER